MLIVRRSAGAVGCGDDSRDVAVARQALRAAGGTSARTVAPACPLGDRGSVPRLGQHHPRAGACRKRRPAGYGALRAPLKICRDGCHGIREGIREGIDIEKASRRRNVLFRLMLADSDRDREGDGWDRYQRSLSGLNRSGQLRLSY